MQVVGITTYNRNECLYQLIDALPPCHIVVVDDHSPIPVEHPRINNLYRNSKNNGRNEWYKTVNKLFSMMMDKRANYYYMIPDDAVPIDGYFEESQRIWLDIKDKRKVSLHLTNNGREQNWTNFKRRDYNEDAFLSQTTEFHFMCQRMFLRYKIPKVNPNRWKENPLAGSGVGEGLNRFWVHRRHCNIYGVKHSLIKKSTICTESMMNPQARKLHGWNVL